MPELPEVEVTRRNIEKHLVGRQIRALKTSAPSYFFLTPPLILKRRLTGKSTIALRRHGKYLVAQLSDGAELLLHLGMTGQLFTSNADNIKLGAYPDQHTHLCFEFEDGGTRVFFRDVRKFGKVLWIAAGATEPRLERLGPDALLTTGARLHAAAAKRKAPIKSLLLDQSVVAGIGNIYADEALFLAGIRPTRPSQRVNAKMLESLAAHIVQVLLRSISRGGTTISDFVAPDGSLGSYQDERHVYGRTAQACDRCRTPIRRVVVGGRGTHYCPSCQK